MLKLPIIYMKSVEALLRMKSGEVYKETNKSSIYKGTLLIVGLCIIQFFIDIYLRYARGSVSFLDLLLGRNPYIGTYDYIWFKTSYFLNGEVWRLFTWMFWSQGILQYLIEITVLYMLCRALEKWIGTYKFLITYFVLGIIYLMATYIALGARIHMLFYDYGMGANTLSIIMAIVGVVFTLEFTGGGNPGKRFKIHKSTTIITTLFLFETYIYHIYIDMDRFSPLYAFSFGVLAGLLYSWKNQNIFVLRSDKENKVNNIKYGLENNIENYNINNKATHANSITKHKTSDYIGTIIIIGICIIIFIVDVVMINKDGLVDLYGEATLINWLRCFWKNVEFCTNFSDFILMKTAEVNQGQIWRFFTNVFAHYGLEHMLTNMPVIYFTGKYIEPKIGTLNWISLFLCSSFIVSMSWHLSGSNMTSTGGSSLGLYAFIAIFFLYAFEQGNEIKSRRYETLYVFIYFILGNIPGIGVWGEGHLTSFAVGFVFLFINRGVMKRFTTGKTLG